MVCLLGGLAAVRSLFSDRFPMCSSSSVFSVRVIVRFVQPVVQWYESCKMAFFIPWLLFVIWPMCASVRSFDLRPPNNNSERALTYRRSSFSEYPFCRRGIAWPSRNSLCEDKRNAFCNTQHHFPKHGTTWARFPPNTAWQRPNHTIATYISILQYWTLPTKSRHAPVRTSCFDFSAKRAHGTCTLPRGLYNKQLIKRSV